MKQKQFFSILILIAISFIWGSTFVIVQDAITTLPPFSFNALRFLIAFILLFFFLFFTKSSLNFTPELKKIHFRSGFLLGAFLFLGYVLQTFSLLYTTSGKSGFLTGLSVALVPILSLFILKTKPKLSAIVGIIFALAGLYLLAFTNFNQINQGDLLAFLCAISFGLQIVYTGKYTNQTSVIHLVTIQLGTVALLSGISAIFFEPWRNILNTNIILHPSVISALIITAIFATALAFLGQTYIQKYASPTQVALIFALEPVFAALTDYFWNQNEIGGRGAFGCLLILFGMILAEVNLSKLFKPRKKVS
ncbi:DMT family transporter [Thermoflavimicrobium daqui]|uniref:EamA family transporter n=1 Tax=Thermoflavimicrobium daqui TaxID=2137476 RepID=A0A364K8K6_9BACL|nr:DMT family transporter [Thermoflavimicrobium daqui]RAL26629.1 EamA family transporter [Thermoflavimicrobium daqui]